jgi:hypothetical protein
MSTIFDLLYREYCRARLAEMRKQLLIPVVSDKTLEADCDGGDPADPNDRDTGWDDAATTKEAQPSGSPDS